MFKKGDMLVQIKYNCSKDSPFAIFTGLSMEAQSIYIYTPLEKLHVLVLLLDI